MMSSRGYDMTPTMYSPDGRIYQVEYAMETVKKGTIAIGVASPEGVIIAVEEKARALQTPGKTQKIFQVDSHIGVAAAGYIPDARIMVDNARLFTQNNRISYDDTADVGMVAKYLADNSHQFTQYGGVRPNGVALIIGGVDKKASIFVTDPSGAFGAYAAMAIGAGSDEVNKFLEDKYSPDCSLEEAAKITIQAINNRPDRHNDLTNIKMAKVDTNTRTFENISDDDMSRYASQSGP